MSIIITKRKSIVKTPAIAGYSSHSDTSGIASITHQTEIGEALRELNKDEIDHTRQSGIDLRANLHELEAIGVIAMDSLISLGIIPKSCLSFTRQKKRISVSTRQQGEKTNIRSTQMVDLVTGKKEMDKPSLGLGDKLKGVFSGHKPE